MDKLKMKAGIAEYECDPNNYYAFAHDALNRLYGSYGWYIETPVFSTQREAHDALQALCDRAGIELEWAEGGA
jgi:hypothetical protein